MWIKTFDCDRFQRATTHWTYRSDSWIHLNSPPFSPSQSFTKFHSSALGHLGKAYHRFLRPPLVSTVVPVALDGVLWSLQGGGTDLACQVYRSFVHLSKQRNWSLGTLFVDSKSVTKTWLHREATWSSAKWKVLESSETQWYEKDVRNILDRYKNNNNMIKKNCLAPETHLGFS